MRRGLSPVFLNPCPTRDWRFERAACTACTPRACASAMVPLVLDIREVRTQALSGQLSVEQLLHIIEQQQRTIDRLKREARRWLERLAHYEPEVRESNQVNDTASDTAA